MAFDNVVNRISALQGIYEVGCFDLDGRVGVVLTEVPNLSLTQIVIWPENIKHLALELKTKYEIVTNLLDRRVAHGNKAVLLQVGPSRWWCYGISELYEIPAEHGVSLDLSHSLVQLRLSGDAARQCLNRLIPIDLRPSACGVDSLFSTSLHHVGVTIWHSKEGFQIFVPRGVACDIWTILRKTSEQFGLEII